MGQRTAADDITEAYCIERGYTVSEHEPDLGIGKRIEFKIESGDDGCLTEVKEFDLATAPMTDGKGRWCQKETLKPIRSQIHEGAHKLKKAKDLGLPLVVVLVDAQGAMERLLNPFQIVAAMKGDLEILIPERGPVVAPTLAAGRNGELRNDHPYLSAVTVLHRNWNWDKCLAHTFVTHSPGATPLSPAFFSGPDDLVFDYTEGDEFGEYLLRARTES